MPRYTFDLYVWTDAQVDGEHAWAETAVDWYAYPVQGDRDWNDVLAQANWREWDTTRIGTLRVAWNGHPKGALIISDWRDVGNGFVVSNEPWSA